MKTLLLSIGVAVGVAVSALSIAPSKVSTITTQPAGGTTTVSPQAMSAPSGSDTTKSVAQKEELNRSSLDTQDGVGDTTKVKE